MTTLLTLAAMGDFRAWMQTNLSSRLDNLNFLV